jgi:small-conductance mechanosensitive channel
MQDYWTSIQESITAHPVWFIAWTAILLVTLISAWAMIPTITKRSFSWIEHAVPGDYPSLIQPIQSNKIQQSIIKALRLTITSGVLIVGTITFTAGVGDNQEAIWALAREFGLMIANWFAGPGLHSLIVVFPAYLIYRFAKHLIPIFINDRLRKASEEELETEIEKHVKTLTSVLMTGTSAAIVTITFLLVMAQLGINLAPLLAAAGVVGIAVGFGAQSLVRDIFSGIFIILENQYRVGDVVSVAGTVGIVEDINLRRTVLRDIDYIQHFIPNGEIKTASNYTKTKSRVHININVAYKEDLDHVITVLNRVGNELAEDPEWSSDILSAPQVLRVDNFGDSGIDLKVIGETVPIRQWDVMGQYRLRVKKAFDEAGIEIPFPHVTLYWGVGEPNVVGIQHADSNAPSES